MASDDFGGSSALGNPNDRRRINKITRYLAQEQLGGDLTSVKDKTLDVAKLARDAVTLWEAEKATMAGRSEGFKRYERGSYAENFKADKLSRKGLTGQDAISDKDANERRLAYARLRRAVASAFQAQDPFAYGKGYSSAALGSHASRYLSRKKKGTVDKTGKGNAFKRFDFKTKKIITYRPEMVSIPGVMGRNEVRYGNRAMGQWGKSLPFKPTPNHFARGVGDYEDWGGRYAKPGEAEETIVVEKPKNRRGAPKAKNNGVGATGLAIAKTNPSYADLRPRVRKGGTVTVLVPEGPGLKDVREVTIDVDARRSNMRGKSSLKAGKMSFKELVKSGALSKYQIGDDFLTPDWTRSHRRKRTAAQKAHTAAFGAFVKQHKRKPQAGEIKAMLSAKNNPGSALTNPTYDSVVPFVTEYAVPVAVIGAVAGGVHFAAQKFGVTEKITSGLEMIPVVGAPVAKYAPFTVQGLIAGSVLAIGASYVGGTAGKYMAMAAGGAIAFGGGIDAFNYLAGSDAVDGHDFGDLAFESVAATEAPPELAPLGALSFTGANGEVSDLLTERARSAGGNLAGFSVASLSSEDYGQSSLGDSYSSGADFSGAEGECLVNGKQTWLGRFGLPPVRAAARLANAQSHLAGREGHRWGWLIKMIGWERAQRLACLPPKQRLILIAKLRKAAIAAFQQGVATDLASQAAASAQLSSGATAPDLEKARILAAAAEAGVPAADVSLPAAGQVLSGACGPTGVASANTDYMGDYLGEPFQIGT